MEIKCLSDNNIAIYSYPSVHVHSFCISLFIKAGIIYHEEQSGITHFWEHIEFRNLNRLFQNDLYKTIDQYGLEFGACTYKEFVQFKITGARCHFKVAADIITKIFEPLCISKSDIDLERKRIKREITEEDEASSLDHFSEQITWKETGLTNLITGTKTSIEKISLQKLKEFKKQTLIAKNMFFYVTGCVLPENVEYLKSVISKYIIAEGISRDNVVPIPHGFLQRNAQIAIKNNSYHYIRLSFDIKTSKYTVAELDLLYDILFKADSCKFNAELSDESGLVYGYDARLERYANAGILYFSYEISEINIYDSIRLIIRILDGIKRELTNEDLKTVLPIYTDKGDMLLDDPDALCWTFGYNNHILNENLLTIDNMKQSYRSVHPERLRQIAGELFTKENLVLTIKGNKNKIQIDKIRKIIDELE